MPLETGVDEAGGGMRQDSQASQRALAFEACCQRGAQLDVFPSAAKHKFTRMQNPRIAFGHLEHLGEILLVFGRIDVGVFAVVENAEESVETHIN